MCFSQKVFHIAVNNLDQECGQVAEIYEHATQCTVCSERLNKALEEKIRILKRSDLN